MKRNVSIGIAAALLSLALALVAYEWRAPDSGSSSDDDAVARRMWATIDSQPGGELELKDLESSLKRNPDHIPILLRMAEIHRQAGKREEALVHLRKAVKVDTQHREARLELGRVLFEAGDVEGAIRETEELLKIDPASTDALYNLGAIYGNIGRDDRAREFWTKAVDIAPESESGQRAKTALAQLGR